MLSTDLASLSISGVYGLFVYVVYGQLNVKALLNMFNPASSFVLVLCQESVIQWFTFVAFIFVLCSLL